MSAKYPISALPLPPAANLLIKRLTPDSLTPSVSAFRNKILKSTPSVQRRPRLLDPPCHFSFVNPLPLPFPYDINPPDPSNDPATQDKISYIENWIAAREAVHERPTPQDTLQRSLRLYDPHNRQQTRLLIGISETGLRDCIPHLEVGDAFAVLGVPSLSDEFNSDGDSSPSHIEHVVNAREDLIDVLSGYSVLMTPPDVTDDNAFAPWSLRYSGHQFGNWAGQLGDGRAISILVTPHPTHPDLTYELQLKGAGRTPFSRTADGLAVVRSSIREYLCSEAMQALKIPTTRSLSLVYLPGLPVARERMETACVLTRMAPSFLRIGSFEALNGPSNMFFFGGGQQEPHWEGLRILGEWVTEKVLKLDCVANGKRGQWGKDLVLDVARRNAKMVAAWQAYGFMHGVINTDNVSVLGLTIDYGPYAFMDVFDSFHVCNHTDETGRYSYKYQPNMIVYALRKLLDALAPLIGAESSLGEAVKEGWAKSVSDEKLVEWRDEGLKLRSELERITQEVSSKEYGLLMRKRLGLRREDPKDETKIFSPLLSLMESYKLDFHGTFRMLCGFRPRWLQEDQDGGETNNKEALRNFVSRILKQTPDADGASSSSSSILSEADGELKRWLEEYAARITSEREEWTKDSSVETDVDEEREKAMRAVNPRFVLRQWVLEDVISRVEKDAESGRRVLAKVMHMACNPFEPWGAEEDELPDEELDKEEREERRFCGMGEKRMLGFQCSCSS